jgi:hypothetical protein
MKKANKQRLQNIVEERDVDNMQADLNRARSVTVGTAFGGITELMMRSNSGDVLWCILQPVEVIELIHQMAASIGCHIHVQPRRDFASWRDWKYTEEELAHYRGVQPWKAVGWPPHPNEMGSYHQAGANLPAPEEQPGLQPNLMARSTKDAVATEKPKNRKNIKRSAKAP